MALSARVTERLGTARLTQLTRPEGSNSTTADTTILGYACDDASALFQAYVGEAYDETVAGHVAVAVQAVEIILKEWGGHISEEAVAKTWERWENKARTLARSRARGRILPQTDSDLTPSTEVESGAVVRPDFDLETFADYVADD